MLYCSVCGNYFEKKGKWAICPKCGNDHPLKEKPKTHPFEGKLTPVPPWRPFEYGECVFAKEKNKELLLKLRHDIETIGCTVYGNDPTIFIPYNEVIRRINKYIDECETEVR